MNGKGYGRQNQPAPKRRKQFKPNREGMMALGIFVLIVIVVIALVVLTFTAILRALRSDTPIEESTESAATLPQTTAAPEPVVSWNDGYLRESVSSEKVSEGTLILVNYDHFYSQTDKIVSKLSPLYGSAGYNNGIYALKDSSVKLRREIVSPLCSMLTDLIEASGGSLGTDKTGDRIIISGGYRSGEYQEALYQNATEENYVAKPGYSEHHTGYAIDLKVYTAAGKTVDFRDNEYLWLSANCARYGFILRYDGAKFETTGILDESWHYRYVGVPHACYMAENDLCLEEYLELLRTSYRYDTTPLSVSANGTDYLIYYFPASGDSTTFVPVPPKSLGSYEISGDNENGYIVTVTLS